MRGALRSALLALACLAACREEPAPAPPAGSAVPQAPARRPVVAEAIAALEAQLATTPSEELASQLEEQVRGLLNAAASRDARVARVARDDLASLGAPAVATLARVLLEREAPADERRAAAEALGALALPESVEALLALLERSRTDVEREPWLYALCAWQIGRAGQDQAVPKLLLALRYETDHQTVVWIADSLARLGNLAGVEALWIVAREGPDAQARAEALAVLARLAGECGVAAEELAALWSAGDGRLPPEQLTPRHQLALWSTVQALREWQLRGVDDARFVLSRCREGAAAILARALADEDRYIRVHAAQCLERMGPRARPAAPALLAALADRELAAQSALALGALGHAPAEPELRARLAPAHPLELRVAAATALGRLALGASAPELGRLLAPTEPLELRVAAAIAQSACLPPQDPLLRPALALLGEQLTAGVVEPTVVEQALHAWLQRAAPLDGAAQSASEAWDQHAQAPQDERIARRQALLRTLLDPP